MAMRRAVGNRHVVCRLVLTAATVTGQRSGTKPSATTTLQADITCLAPIPGSSSVAAGLADGQVVVWNGRDPAPLCYEKTGDACSPSARRSMAAPS